MEFSLANNKNFNFFINNENIHREKLLLMQEKPLLHYMFSYHHHQGDTKSDSLAIEGQDWQISQNICPSGTLSQENSFSHFAATDDRFLDFEGSSFDEASGLSLTLPELPRIPWHLAKLLVPLAVFLYRPRSRNQPAFASKPFWHRDQLIGSGSIGLLPMTRDCRQKW